MGCAQPFLMANRVNLFYYINNWMINNVCNNQLVIGKVDVYAISSGELELSYNDIASIKYIIY